VFAVERSRVLVALRQLGRVVGAELLAAAFVRQFAAEALLVELGEDVRRVHEDRQRADKRHDRVDVQQETVEYQ